jgi:hypothetical protein
MGTHFVSKWVWRSFYLHRDVECFSSILEVKLRLLSTRLRDANDFKQHFVEISPAPAFKDATHLDVAATACNRL